MRKLIIIPTYNERENIKKLIIEISKLNIVDLDVLVIDDGSPDGTADVVREHAGSIVSAELWSPNAATATATAAAHGLHSSAETMEPAYDRDEAMPRLYLIQREKKLGLGTAYITGFKWAIERHYDVVVEMDADFSHDPKYLSEFFEKIKQYDFVIGSRYIKNGGVENWTLIRKIISRVGSFYARIILNIKIMDFTGGFNAWQVHVLKAIDLDSIKSNGYAFQIEIKYRAAKKDFKFIEAPIVFKEREAGKSKMSNRIIWEAIWGVWGMRFEKFLNYKL